MTGGVERAASNAVSFAGGIASLVTPGKSSIRDGGLVQPQLPDVRLPKMMENVLRSALGGAGYSLHKEVLTSREGDISREVTVVGGPVRLVLLHIPPEVVTSAGGAGQGIGGLEFLLPPASRTFLFSTGVDEEEVPPSITSILEQWARGGLDVTFKSWSAVTSLTGRDDPEAAVVELLELPAAHAAPAERAASGEQPEVVEVFVARDEADAKEKYLGEMIEWLRGGLRRFGFAFSVSDQVPTGEDRDRWIAETLEGANVLLAVVTQNLLNSYLNDRIAEVAERRRSRPWLYPVLLGPCDWESYEWIKRAAPQPKDGTIGENYSSKWKRQALFNRILNEIRDRKEEFARARGEPDGEDRP